MKDLKELKGEIETQIQTINDAIERFTHDPYFLQTSMARLDGRKLAYTHVLEMMSGNKEE